MTVRRLETVHRLRYFRFCNVLHIWTIRAIPTYRVYRLSMIIILLYTSSCRSRTLHPCHVVKTEVVLAYRIYSNIVAAATINFAPSSVRLLIEGGYYLFRARAMIDTAARMRYVYIRTYAGQRPPDEFIARARGYYYIRGRLLFFGARATCGYYSMCGYYSNKYGT